MSTTSNTCFFGPLESTSQTASRSVQPFLQSSLQWVPILYTFHLKIVPSHVGSGPPSNTSFLGPTRVNNPNSTSAEIGWQICSTPANFTGYPILASLLHRQSVQPFCRAHNSERQNDRAHYSVSNNRLHLRSTAMRSNNKEKALIQAHINQFSTKNLINTKYQPISWHIM